MAEEKKITDPTLARFYKAMEKTNMEKITNEMLAGLSENSSDSESFDVESGNEDAEDRPWRPSHVVFGKSTVKQGQIEAMRGRYFCDISIVRAGGENTVPLPEADVQQRSPVEQLLEHLVSSHNPKPTLSFYLLTDYRHTGIPTIEHTSIPMFP
jgi:hypothetical protein